MKLSRLIDNSLRRFIAFVLAICSVMAISDYSVATLDIPALETLSPSTGKIAVIFVKSKYSSEYSLRFRSEKNARNITLKCRLSEHDDTICTDLPGISGLISPGQNHIPTKGLLSWKNARVWWYPSPEFGNFGVPRLMQLEVDGVMIRDYDSMKQHYLDLKNSHLYIWTYIFVLMGCLFVWLNLPEQRDIDLV